MTELGKRDFDSYVERSQGEAFYQQAERLTSAYLSSIESVIYDPNEEGTVEERITRNTDQFIAALQAAVQTVFTGESSTDPIEKGRPGIMSKRSDVVVEATRIAEENFSKGEAGSMAAVRAQVWRENPDLARRYHELPVETLEAPAPPVFKGAGAVAAIDIVAAEIRKSHPEISESQARVQAWRTRPDLRSAHNEALTRK